MRTEVGSNGGRCILQEKKTYIYGYEGSQAGLARLYGKGRLNWSMEIR
jgi:hypothetical protein